MYKFVSYNYYFLHRFASRCKTPKEDEGMALVLALITGLLLLTGATGLLIRQLMARKIGAAESYQQMAEAAATNGFNRILNTLNSNDTNNYKGYLYTIENGETSSSNNWAYVNSKDESTLDELCTDISDLPSRPSQSGAIWPTGLVAKDGVEANISFPFIEDQTRTQRNDGKGSIQTFYRLRKYKDPAKAINGSYEGRKGPALFQVEGFTRRVGSPEGEYLARALLTRSLAVRSVVSKPEDWGVLAANNFDLGSTTINGLGLIIWNVEDKDKVLKADGSGCRNDLAALINGNSNALTDRIWPVMNRDLPSQTLFWNRKTSKSTKQTFDKDPKSQGIPRVWSFDDSIYCGEEQIVCTRALNSQTMSAPEGIDIDYKVIGKTTVKTFKRKTHPLGIYWSATRFCKYTYCFKGKPTFREGYERSENPGNINYGDYWTSWIPEEKELKEWTVRIKKQDICADKDDACHLYIEHMNLENTTVLIENDQRPVVLHLGGPYDTTLSKRIDLSNKSKLCGVNAGGTTCNENPERLVIMAKPTFKTSSDCNSDDLEKPNYLSFNKSNSHVINIADKSLPAAFVLLNRGTFTLSSDAEMRGVVWADNFCSQDNKFKLTTKRKDGIGGSVIEAGDELWNLVDGENLTGYGRTITRGVRGTGLDIFQRW